MVSLMEEPDFYNLIIPVKPRPKIIQSLDKSTGVIDMEVVKSIVKPRNLTIIVQPNSLPLYPHNQFLYSLLKEGKDSTATEAQALMAFERFLAPHNKTYKSLTEDQEEGAPWLFADYLLDNLKVVNPATGLVLENPNGYSISTARSYIDVVIKFYKWLHSSGLFFISETHKPFEFKTVTLRRGQKVNQHDILAHLNNKKLALSVQTTDLKKRFPKVESTPEHMKLKPMTEDDKDIFIEHLKIKYSKGFKKIKSLMYRLTVETGLRIEELVTFPDSGIHFPMEGADEIPFLISLANGCQTKFDKPRIINIPYDLMLELDVYLNRDDRKVQLNKGVNKLKGEYKKKVTARKEYIEKYGLANAPEEPVPVHDDYEHGRLFISARGLPYSVSTIQSELSVIRENIKMEYPHWYYRIHDLRSTFATHWLKKEAEKRGILFDILMQELADLMGHESTVTTQKYITFMRDKAAKLLFSHKKNKLAQDALA
ncbi:MAG: integrase [Colwellia sp.]|jgi:integrase